MSDSDVLHAMSMDDSYIVSQVLADSPTGKTELVTLEGSGPFIRKRIPLAIANPTAWASVMGIDDPRIPKVRALYETPDELCVVTDYIDGKSLKDAISTLGSLPVKVSVQIASDICAAAQVLHEKGLVHRDITPANIILTETQAYLIDLGIARQYSESDTRDTTTLGTYGFAAPEQFGFAQTDARSDVYSIGCILGYAITGISPDNEAYAAELAKAAPEGIVAAIQKACSFEPSDRWQSAAEFTQALQNAQTIPAASSATERQKEALNLNVRSDVPATVSVQTDVPVNLTIGGTSSSSYARPVIHQQLSGHVSAKAPESSKIMTPFPVKAGSLRLIQNAKDLFKGEGNFVVFLLSVLGILFTIAFFLAGISSVAKQGSIGNKFTYTLFSIDIALTWAFIPLQEVCLFFLREDVYSDERTRGKSLRNRILTSIICGFIVMVILAMISIALFGSESSSSTSSK